MHVFYDWIISIYLLNMNQIIFDNRQLNAHFKVLSVIIRLFFIILRNLEKNRYFWPPDSLQQVRSLESWGKFTGWKAQMCFGAFQIFQFVSKVHKSIYGFVQWVQRHRFRIRLRHFWNKLKDLERAKPHLYSSTCQFTPRFHTSDLL